MTLFRAHIVLILLLCISSVSCTNSEPRTFAGFTFGGGGNTFDAEPATVTEGPNGSILEAGAPSDKVYLKLSWPKDSAAVAKKLDLSEATIIVPKISGQNTLKNGHIVLQAIDGSIVHGSFELTTKTQDGREQDVVGSFTATQ